MKAAVHTSYGPPDVVRIAEVEKPAAKADAAAEPAEAEKAPAKKAAAKKAAAKPKKK